MNTPGFSVITVTRDNLFGLRKTYESLKGQNFDDYEWIVVDGNSTDDTLKFLKNTNAHVISEPDNGIYDAMNKAIDKAVGDYLIFMNAGDCFSDPEILSFLHQKIIELKPDFLYGDSIEKTKQSLRYKKSRNHRKIKQGMFTHHQAMVYRRELLENLRYNLDYSISADYDLTLKALQNAQNIYHVPIPLCIFEAGGISQQKVLTGRKEQFQIRKENGISAIKNIFIFLGQTLLYQCRRFFPSGYWWLKRH
jgi:putative colanic acid biosynthesis glycosyltransferase